MGGWSKWQPVARSVAPRFACAALLAGLLPASPALAFHIPGADYNGAVGGGGTVSFSVSSDGSSVTNLTLTDIHRSDCSLSSRRYSQPIPITNNTFQNGEVSGDFPNVRGAYGRLNVVASDLVSSCRIATTWSATTGASPSGSQECKSAQAQVKKAKRALRKATKTRSERKIRKRRKRWRAAVAKRDQFC
jgi:hypothetical protein